MTARHENTNESPLLRCVETLDAWQSVVALSEERAVAWERSVRAERRARDESATRYLSTEPAKPE